MLSRTKFPKLIIVFCVWLSGCVGATRGGTFVPITSVAPTAVPTNVLTPIQPGQSSPDALTTPAPSSVEHMRVEVVNRYPHDRDSYTEGLLWVDGKVYESGGYFRISLREADLTTGQLLRTQTEEGDHFGEGIAVVGDEIILLTLQEQTAYRYDLATFERKGTYTYSGEGWGLCYDGTSLYQSNGTHTINLRDPQTFEFISAIDVTLDGQPVEQLNELECVGDSLYANVWFSTDIMRIDKATGEVTAVVDASGLVTPEEIPADINAVLNGIAYVPERDTYLITGKWWPWLFEVKLVAAQP